jgi:hypothetical protein
MPFRLRTERAWLVKIIGMAPVTTGHEGEDKKIEYEEYVRGAFQGHKFTH